MILFVFDYAPVGLVVTLKGYDVTGVINAIFGRGAFSISSWSATACDSDNTAQSNVHRAFLNLIHYNNY